MKEYNSLPQNAMAGRFECKYSCATASDTLEWIKVMVDFLKPFTLLMNTHVVNFFNDRLWEAVDKDWIECLRNEPIENLLLIPSVIVQDHWPDSLKEFVPTLKSLVFPREQADLRTMECKEVKAVVSIGCCYNLLSEEGIDTADSLCGFPMSCGVKFTGFPLGKSSRDLTCQSGKRWRSLEGDAGVHNFELHAFCAAFQMVLSKYYPEVIMTSPSVGLPGKALHCQQQRRMLESNLHIENRTCPSFDLKQCEIACSFTDTAASKTDDKSVSMLGIAPYLMEIHSTGVLDVNTLFLLTNIYLLRNFLYGLCCIDLKPLDNLNLQGIWDKAEPFADIIGPYWSLRAALGPLLETYILLDRLLFLQEHGRSLEAVMLPIFDPVLAPMYVAILLKRQTVDTNNAT